MSKKKIKQAPVIPVRASSPKIQLKDYQKNIIAFLGVFIILLIVLSPMAFKGLRPGGVDVIGSKGASHQRAEYEKETGEMALWNSPVFSGMPIYHRLGGKVFSADTFITRILGKILYLNIWMYLIGFMGMFFLLRQLKISYFAAVFGALAFMFIPHYMSLLSIGHFQKFRPIMFMPFVTYFFIAFLNRKHLLYLIGFIIALSVQIRTLHFQ
ncbi:MAG: hypothetical protein H8E57_01095, partial [Candidatus Cloacimonetes bacterium]|nr:hypothetical protein [Candidatus Cloacimonadota bacterium]